MFYFCGANLQIKLVFCQKQMKIVGYFSKSIIYNELKAKLNYIIFQIGVIVESCLLN